MSSITIGLSSRHWSHCSFSMHSLWSDFDAKTQQLHQQVRQSSDTQSTLNHSIPYYLISLNTQFLQMSTVFFVQITFTFIILFYFVKKTCIFKKRLLISSTNVQT